MNRSSQRYQHSEENLKNKTETAMREDQEVLRETKLTQADVDHLMLLCRGPKHVFDSKPPPESFLRTGKRSWVHKMAPCGIDLPTPMRKKAVDARGSANYGPLRLVLDVNFSDLLWSRIQVCNVLLVGALEFYSFSFIRKTLRYTLRALGFLHLSIKLMT